MMSDSEYQKRNLKPDFSTALAKAEQRQGRRRWGRDESSTGMNWLITFTDIMGLMLTFFVMMYAMSVPEQEKFAEIASSLSSELKSFSGDVSMAGPEDSLDMRRVDFNRALDLNYLQTLIGAVIERDETLKSRAVLVPQGDRLALTVPGILNFESRQAQLGEGSAQVLFALGGSFSRVKNRIELNGYSTAEERVAGQASGWALSLSRAVAVAASLEKVGYTEPVVLRGMTAGGDEENQRRDLSRRVDIVIMNHDGRMMRVFRD